MIRFSGAALCLALLAGGAAAQAQNAPARNAANASAPEVLLMQAGSDRLMQELEYLLSLTTAEEQQQWRYIKDWVVDMFLPGIDGKNPVGIDVIFGNPATRYRPQFPISSLDKFRENLALYGILSRRRAASLLQLQKSFDGFLRYRHRYAIIGEQEGDVPLTVPDPKVELMPLVQAGFSSAFRLRNDPQGVAPRRNDFQRIRRDLMATVKQNADETKEEFDVRRTLAEQQMNELERFYAEARYALLGWTTDIRQHEGRLDVTLEPIANTSLAASFALLNQAPSHFANVPKAEDSILSLRVNHPLDQMRTDHGAEFVKVARPAMHRRIDDDEQRSAEEKQAGKNAADLALDMLDATARAGLADVVVEVATRKTGKHALIAGIRVADGNAIHAIVPLLPQARSTRKVQMDVAKVGETRIHKVDLQIENAAVRQDFYGQDLGLYVGGDQHAVWIGMGEGALDDLKAAIDAVGKPNAGKKDDPFVDLRIKLAPWIELRSNLVAVQPKAAPAPAPAPRPRPAPGADGERSVADEITEQIDLAELRRFAREAFAAGDDVLILQLTRKNNNEVGGKMAVERGLLRMVGKGLSQFSKDQLAPRPPGR